MITRLLLRFGFVPLANMSDAVADAWAEADRERAGRLEIERRFREEYAASPDGLADRLDEIGARFPVVVARHS